MTVTALITALNQTGIPFTLDAWDGADISDDYGVVEITGSSGSVWGDNALIIQQLQGNVVLYAFGGTADAMDAVQAVLNTAGISYTLASREYLEDLNANRYTWRFQLQHLPAAEAD